MSQGPTTTRWPDTCHRGPFPRGSRTHVIRAHLHAVAGHMSQGPTPTRWQDTVTGATAGHMSQGTHVTASCATVFCFVLFLKSRPLLSSAAPHTRENSTASASTSIHSRCLRFLHHLLLVAVEEPWAVGCGGQLGLLGDIFGFSAPNSGYRRRKLSVSAPNWGVSAPDWGSRRRN